MPRRPDRPEKKARLTTRSWQGWDRYLTRRNVSFNTIIEAIGERLAEGDEAVLEPVLARARQLDSERRSRRA